MTLPRVNSDEIAAENGWDPRAQSSQLKAGRIAVEQIRRHLAARESFNQETTLTGKAIMRNIRNAHDARFQIVMFYVCVDDPATANERIAKRDALGGHFVPPEMVARRYDASLANLVDAIPLCDEIYLYDNSEQLELEASFARGALVYFNPNAPCPAWVMRSIEALGYTAVDF